MASFPFSRLPVELQLDVLACLPDHFTLMVAVLSHSSLKELYLLSPERIIRSIMSSDHPQVQRLAFATIVARYHTISRCDRTSVPLHEIESFLDWESNPNREKQFFSKDANPIQILQVLVDYTKETTRLAQAWAEFASYHASHLYPTQTRLSEPASAQPLSPTERTRIFRALWRMQLYAELFPPSENSWTRSDKIDCNDFIARRYARLRFFSLLPPWELAEIKCADLFLSNRYFHLKEVEYTWLYGDSWTNCLIARLGYETDPCTFISDLRHPSVLSTALARDITEEERLEGPNGTWKRIQESSHTKNETMYRFWEALGLFLWDEERLEGYGLMTMDKFTPKDGLDRIAVTLDKEGNEFRESCVEYNDWKSRTTRQNRGPAYRRDALAKVDAVLAPPIQALIYERRTK